MTIRAWSTAPCGLEPGPIKEVEADEQEERKEHVAEKVNVEVSAVETQTVEKEVTAEKNSA